eukprot:TRINITY_DN8565_c0_g1_i1.p1 TRINITY_DN8565_c0_g1~~TRINITY_DN8565_c0_g1_i1.p1  ORF type:complete len:107 (+),score=6.85 TRINITY_DN8565_c0_g1_i1:397-717(+)
MAPPPHHTHFFRTPQHSLKRRMTFFLEYKRSGWRVQWLVVSHTGMLEFVKENYLLFFSSPLPFSEVEAGAEAAIRRNRTFTISVTFQGGVSSINVGAGIQKNDGIQ